MSVETGSGSTLKGKEYSYKITQERDCAVYELCLKDVEYMREGDIVYSSNPFSLGNREWELDVCLSKSFRFMNSIWDKERRLKVKAMLDRTFCNSTVLPLFVWESLDHLICSTYGGTLFDWTLPFAAYEIVLAMSAFAVQRMRDREWFSCCGHGWLQRLAARFSDLVSDTETSPMASFFIVCYLFFMCLDVMLFLASSIFLWLPVMITCILLLTLSVVCWLPSILFCIIMYWITYAIWATFPSISAKLTLLSNQKTQVRCKATAVHSWWALLNKSSSTSGTVRLHETIDVDGFVAAYPCLERSHGYLTGGWLTIRVEIAIVDDDNQDSDLESQLSQSQARSDLSRGDSAEGEEDVSLCISCRQRPKTSGYAHKNILHVCVCELCLWEREKLRSTDNTCPLCQRSVDYLVHKIY